ncbi:hypothetical protein EMIHUDRAFT_253634 [Emiliania huxleyi CCMP1516]|uniref:Uncharacterized protein n=2 Tax=Emiliania huxleyi TaxID=2903 RepID=A0A0D3K512_EMIH1|nr:hypothetical protein EMIHUDRAFT_253634 [Emiliania huxleyi CCMP1516]EOD30847.1 hypothetical protein EMIHUDRAFT_253634 [Emiliania huxleyi CCMP1516]|eukprot:XP_005783276.1 hypothetical protein EMIHUDRAFT_253634 [Emiliania huxleyi CCMP1516]
MSSRVASSLTFHSDDTSVSAPMRRERPSGAPCVARWMTSLEGISRVASSFVALSSCTSS